MRTILSLSQKPFVGPYNGVPNILILYRRPSFISAANDRATNSDPNVYDSIIFWRLECHFTGALFMKNNIPFVDRLVIRSIACDASQNVFNWTAFSLGFGALVGLASPSLTASG